MCVRMEKEMCISITNQPNPTIKQKTNSNSIKISRNIPNSHLRNLPTPSNKESSTIIRCGNDPSAGSPTETLLRLHLPLNDEV